ncbi:hypothetical protein DVH05_017229 [Phytophthora capsici]|nr:hypothetical protein DVH05_017229 [Phytophthora capsici]
MTLQNGVCTCTGGQDEVATGVCACTGGQQLVSGSCACTGGQELVSGTCACTGGQSLENGQCQCTGGQSLHNNVCECPSGQSLVGGECSCPNDMVYENGACVCTGGQTEISTGVCACTGGQSLENGACTCPPEQSLVNGVCDCPTGQTYENSACTCTGGQTETSPGVCQCTGGQSLHNNVCECPTGQSLVGGECSCPSGMVYENGACRCTGGQTETSPGVCECTGGQSLENEVCTCTGGQSLVSGVCTCPGDQSLVNGVCSCPGDQTLVGNTCSCPGDQSLLNNVCSCPGDQTLVGNTCSCPGDQTLIGGVCSCPGDQSLVNNVCSCPGDQTLVNNVCSCPGDQTIVNGVCSCPGDQSLVNNVCSCPGDQTLVNGACSCPGDQTLVNGVCSCPGDQTLVNNVCSCHGDQTFVNGVCSCPGDQTLVNGVCSCPGDQTLVSGTCSCPGDQSLVNNVCSCPGDQTLVGNTCSCPGDQTLVNNVCSCPGDQYLLNNVCSCPGDQTLANGVCSCPGDQTLVNGVCSCPGNQIFVNNACGCPGDQTFVNNVCSCPGDQTLVNGVCSCPGDQTLVNNACSCPGDQTLVNNVCSCPGDQTLNSGVCSCPGDQILVNGFCSCPGNQVLIDGVCCCPEGQSLVGGVCSCPSGEHVENGECVSTCYWKENNVGFQCPWSDHNLDHLKLKDDCKVNAPVSKDNYVNDGRTNANDPTKTDPVIAITATKEGDATGVEHKTPWKDYALTPQNLENEVTFSSFGVFDLLFTSTDYHTQATCTGCIAVTDNYPPTALDKCTATDTHATPVLYSASNLITAIAEEAKFTAFYNPNNIVNNGAYDPTTGANERCDVTTATVQDFFASSPVSSTMDTACYDDNFVTHLLDAKPNVNPILLTELEMKALQCSRCCSKSITLQEYYYEYQCGTALADTVKKTSSSDSCSFGYCLQMPSNTLVTSTAGITTAANTKTATTIAGLPTPISPGVKDIHRSIPCTSFSDGCSFNPLLGDLFEHSSQWGVSVPASYNIDEYVFWRYSVGTENWHSWDDLVALEFTEPQTDIYVEAWTHCGLAFSDKFTLYLHVHSARPKCVGFNEMWNELTAYPHTVESHMCSYPNSDFVLMQFAYDSETGMTHDANTVRGKYTDVKCYVTLAASGELASVTKVEVPLVWTPETNGRIVVSKELALELVHESSTAVNTDVQVQCDFTFTHYGGTTTEIDSCPHSFTVTDCEGPTVETYGKESVCKAGECMSPTGMPGPFEACSGSVFTTEGSTTKQKTVTGDCCAECSTTLVCTALRESGVDGVERCEPATTGALIVMALRGEAEWKDAATPSMVMALMGVSTMVAVVALVVVKRRNARAARGGDEYDVYYPLLS